MGDPAPNGGLDLGKLLGKEQQIAVGLPVGPGGAIQPVPWQAGLVWELDQIRMLLAAAVKERVTDAGS